MTKDFIPSKSYQVGLVSGDISWVLSDLKIITILKNNVCYDIL